MSEYLSTEELAIKLGIIPDDLPDDEPDDEPENKQRVEFRHFAQPSLDHLPGELARLTPISDLRELTKKLVNIIWFSPAAPQNHTILATDEGIFVHDDRGWRAADFKEEVAPTIRRFIDDFLDLMRD